MYTIIISHVFMFCIDDDIEETFRKVKPPMIGKVHVPFYADKANLTSSSSCEQLECSLNDYIN